TTAVVAEGRASVVVLPADHSRLVVGDLVRAHRAEPGHDQLPAELPGLVSGPGQPEVAIVFAISTVLAPFCWPGQGILHDRATAVNSGHEAIGAPPGCMPDRRRFRVD